MGNALGLCETRYKVKNKEKVLLGEIRLASQNVTTRGSLLYVVDEDTDGRVKKSSSPVIECKHYKGVTSAQVFHI